MKSLFEHFNHDRFFTFTGNIGVVLVAAGLLDVVLEKSIAMDSVSLGVSGCLLIALSSWGNKK